MTIRAAARSDCAKLDALLTKLIRYESQYDKNLNPGYVVENNYSERLDWPGHRAYVAESDGEIVGFVYGFAFPIPGMYLKPIAIVDALFVEENHRNKGVAAGLLREFISFAKEQNACSVELKVMSENMEAVHFYEALGFSENRKYMRISV